MKRLALLILSLFVVSFAKAQIAIDTLSTEALNTLLIEQVERMAEDTDEDINYEELLDNYIFLSDNPINLNSDDVAQLVELHLINAFQYEELKKYRRYYGDFMFLDELAMVEGFDEQTIEIIRPLVSVGKDNSKDKITFKKLGRYGKHQILGRYEQVLEKQQGYLPITDSALLAKPNSRYLGCPQKLQFRYTYNYRNRIRAGIVVEKDAGEMFFTDKVSDTIKALLGKKYSRGFDFIGFHIYAKDLGIVKAAVLGDYQLSFGQGLTLWSGMTFGKAGAGSSVMRQGRGISPKSSASEYAFMRGAAVTLGKGPFSGTVFYSNRLVDANVSVTDTWTTKPNISAAYKKRAITAPSANCLTAMPYGNKSWADIFPLPSPISRSATPHTTPGSACRLNSGPATTTSSISKADNSPIKALTSSM